MLKRKLKDGTVVGLSLESVQGGVLLTLDNQPADSTVPKFQQSFLLNPCEASELIDGLRKDYVRIDALDGRKLEFASPPVWRREPIYVQISESESDYIRFPLKEHEIRFVRKALESMTASLLFVGTWSGEPEEL